MPELDPAILDRKLERTAEACANTGLYLQISAAIVIEDPDAVLETLSILQVRLDSLRAELDRRKNQKSLSV